MSPKRSSIYRHGCSVGVVGWVWGVEPPSSSSPPAHVCAKGLGVSRDPPALASTLNIFTTDMFLQYVQTWTSMKWCWEKTIWIDSYGRIDSNRFTLVNQMC